MTTSPSPVVAPLVWAHDPSDSSPMSAKYVARVREYKVATLWEYLLTPGSQPSHWVTMMANRQDMTYHRTREEAEREVQAEWERLVLAALSL